MARKKKEADVEQLHDGETVLVFRANKPLDKKQFELLSDLVQQEEEKAGVKIIVVPHSVDLEEVKTEESAKETEEDNG